MFFLHKSVKPLSVKWACSNSSEVMSVHDGMDLAKYFAADGCDGCLGFTVVARDF